MHSLHSHHLSLLPTGGKRDAENLGCSLKFRIIYESARWLVSQEKYDEANVVLFAAASMNKKTVPKDWANQMEKKVDVSATKKKDSFGIIDLVRTPQMRKRTLANFVMWSVFWNDLVPNSILSGQSQLWCTTAWRCEATSEEEICSSHLWLHSSWNFRLLSSLHFLSIDSEEELCTLDLSSLPESFFSPIGSLMTWFRVNTLQSHLW